MYAHYFYWQFIAAPLWFMRFLWYMQRAVIQFFSVPTMVTTLVAHWHRDRVSYQQGTITGMIHALALNAISRVVGSLIRLSVLLLWLLVEVVFLMVAIVMFILLVSWPFITIAALASGIALLITT